MYNTLIASNGESDDWETTQAIYRANYRYSITRVGHALRSAGRLRGRKG